MVGTLDSLFAIYARIDMFMLVLIFSQLLLIPLGSPYGTPSPRPPYGSNPTDGQYTGGCAPPHPKYY